MDQIPIGGHNARWIRAYAKTLDPAREPFTASRLAIEINPANPCTAAQCPPPDGTPTIQADGMANTAPLVLNNLFYPLGKEPHQFDAFYLGSNEAFSKAGAKVQLCFQMADRTFDALSAVRGVSAGTIRVLAGVGHDRALHLLQLDSATGTVTSLNNRPPLYPPSPAFLTGPAAGSPISLDAAPTWRPAVWLWTPPNNPPGFAVAVCGDSTVWVWGESPSITQSGWVNFGDIPPSTPPQSISSLIVLVEAGKTTLFALRNSKLYRRVIAPILDATWTEVPTSDAGGTIRLLSIVAVREFDATFAETGTAGMVGIDDQGDLYQVSTTGVNAGFCTQLLLGAGTLDEMVLPAAVKVAGTSMVAAVIKDPNLKLIIDRAGVLVAPPLPIPQRQALKALEPVLDGGTLHILVTSTDGTTQKLHDWVPFASVPLGAPTPNQLFDVAIDVANAGGSPTEVDGVVVVPGTHADILSATYGATKRFESSAILDPGIVVSDSLGLAGNDSVIRVLSNNTVQSQDIVEKLTSKDGKTPFRLGGKFDAGSARLDAFSRLPSNTYTSTGAGANWTLDAADYTTVKDGYIQVGNNFFYHVDDIDQQRRPTLTQVIPGPAAPAVPATGAQYYSGVITNGRIAPLMRSVPGTWPVDALDRPVGFPNDNPVSQSAEAFTVGSGHPTLLVFGQEFSSAFNYANQHQFVIEAAFGKWNRDTGGSTDNPELSWEYWNGKGWSRLNLDRDDTLNLQITGPVQFTVPTDIVPSDWAGKTNPWIRARLIGGDYGREKFINTGTTTNPITTRSTEDIHPPSVVNLAISYRLCQATLPAFVLTSDSGSVIEQSEANRSASASVEAFVPLGVTLGRLLQPAGAVSGAGASVDPSSAPCDCPCGTTTADAVPRPATATAGPSTTSSPPASGASSGGPCLLIGIAGTVDGEDVHLLALTGTERDYTTFAPLNVEAIVANRFTQVVASDGTRAFGETGLIEMSFAVPPTRIDLFGQSSLVWLRLAPRSGATSANWNPSIAGLYLNAVFAQSKETLTRELLGSADGSPNLTFTLARPPVLNGTLELRVREPLGDQEFEDLKGLKDLKGRDLVVPEGSDYWVLWEQVDDTANQGAGERVYMLDESTGEIRFGDGERGMIPPIGRDSIVAFSYQRTEPPPSGSDTVPANGIPARTPLNLVSPVETVESVTTAADSAGGSATETTDTVLRFGYAKLRHRERALTLEDFEDLALESSPSIAQARAFPLPRGRVQVIIVMRGNPLPTLSQIRELSRNLLSQGPAALALPEALMVSGPVLRELRIELKLDVESLDKAADVSVEVTDRLKALFDTMTGNLSGDGWPLGLTPAKDVIASKISNVPGLASTKDITFLEVDAKGNELPWPTQIKATELVVLTKDPVRLEFNSLEVVA